jgi:dCTP deaminase
VFLVDKELKRAIQNKTVIITVEDDLCPPFDPTIQIGPSSIDLRLGRVFRKYKKEVKQIDIDQKGETEIFEVALGKEFVIQPGDFFLGVTVERIELPANMIGIISIKSSIARLGISVVGLSSLLCK